MKSRLNRLLLYAAFSGFYLAGYYTRVWWPWLPLTAVFLITVEILSLRIGPWKE